MLRGLWAKGADPEMEPWTLQGCVIDVDWRSAWGESKLVLRHGSLASPGECTAGAPALGHSTADVVLNC